MSVLDKIYTGLTYTDLYESGRVTFNTPGLGVERYNEITAVKDVFLHHNTDSIDLLIPNLKIEECSIESMLAMALQPIFCTSSIVVLPTTPTPYDEKESIPTSFVAIMGYGYTSNGYGGEKSVSTCAITLKKSTRPVTDK